MFLQLVPKSKVQSLQFQVDLTVLGVTNQEIKNSQIPGLSFAKEILLMFMSGFLGEVNLF